MGLTIHYNYAFDGSKQVLAEKLKYLKQRFSELPIKKVHDLREINLCKQEFGYGKYNDERYYQNELGFNLQHSFSPLKEKRDKLYKYIEKVGGTANLHKLTDQELSEYKNLEREVQDADKRLQKRILHSGNGYSLPVEVGDGCEWFEINIGRIGNADKWRGSSFTKTQYAQDFVKSHLSVITMLDLCKDTGILNEVYDEGRYWETRDLKVLAEEINTSSLSIKALLEALRQLAPEGCTVESKIDKSENYMVVDEQMESKKKKRF